MSDPLAFWEPFDSVLYEQWAKPLVLSDEVTQKVSKRRNLRKKLNIEDKLVMAEKQNKPVRYFCNPSDSWGFNFSCIIALPRHGHLMTKDAVEYCRDNSYCIEDCLTEAKIRPNNYKEITQSQTLRLIKKSYRPRMKRFLQSLDIKIEVPEVVSEESKTKVLELLQAKKATNPDSAFAVGDELLDICLSLVDAGILKVPSWDDRSFYI